MIRRVRSWNVLWQLICLSVCLSKSLYEFICQCISLCLSLYLPLPLCVCLLMTMSLSVYVSRYPPVCLPAYLSLRVSCIWLLTYLAEGNMHLCTWLGYCVLFYSILHQLTYYQVGLIEASYLLDLEGSGGGGALKESGLSGVWTPVCGSVYVCFVRDECLCNHMGHSCA